MSENSGATDTKSRAYEWFELATALLFGCGAVGASLAGYEASLWNGKTNESFVMSSFHNTQAAASEHTAVMVSMHDQEIDVEAKKLLADAAVETDETRRRSDMRMAASLYLRHLSKEAYGDLGLPPAQGDAISDDALLKSQDRDLSGTYMHCVFAAAESDREKARAAFETGSQASSHGDRFALAEVLFAVSLFVSGTGLVFKTGLRWVFASVGFVALATAYGYLLRLEWM